MKQHKPTSPGRRFRTDDDFNDITTSKPYKGLLKTLKTNSGRNVHGHITSRHRCGGHKRRYRIVDFKRNKLDIPAKVATIEYDPYRSARIALVNYLDGEKSYIVAPIGLKVGDTIISSNGEIDIKPGNALRIKDIPVGTIVYNIELKPGSGGQLVRSAGCGAQLMGKEGKYGQIKLPSGEMRRVLLVCRASVGNVSNPDHENMSIGKAGRAVWMRKRPQTRGTCMNPVDHPHGGGHGKDHGGRHPVTPWGKPTKGYKTRKNKVTSKYIIRSRKGK